MGLSPHMRGARTVFNCLLHCSRITPAYAGNTQWPERRSGGRPVHPHVCWEHLSAYLDFPTPGGSSPRMRGALIEAVSPFFLGEHPRLCGEHMMLSSSSAFVIGIPLHIRGARIMNHQNHMSAGNIPAYAGSTDVYIHETVFREGHPRLCGEHQVISRNGDQYVGSSPPRRGTRTGASPAPAGHGIIPAYAGSTLSFSPPVLSKGSSPRMRGTLFQRPQSWPSCGITPAYAGNTDRRAGYRFRR